MQSLFFRRVDSTSQCTKEQSLGETCSSRVPGSLSEFSESRTLESSPTNSSTLKHPGVHFPPPLLFVLGIFSGVALEALVPVPMSDFVRIPFRLALGWSLVLAGSGFLVWALTTMTTQKTAIYPNQAARTLVCEGPYRISRNPMYVALTINSLGISFLADNLYILLTLPAVLWAVVTFIINREEAYLRQAFGDEYQGYEQRVRRWL